MAEPARADTDISPDVPPDVQRMIEEKFATNFVYPDTTEWTFVSIEPHYGGRLVCGSVRYQNAMRKYVAPRSFFAVVGPHSIKTGELQMDPSEDITGAAAFTMKTLCHLK